MEKKKKLIRSITIGIILMAMVAMTGIASAEWTKINTCNITAENSEITFQARDGSVIQMNFARTTNGLVEVNLSSVNGEEAIGIAKKTEAKRTMYPASPYQAAPIGKKYGGMSETIKKETLVQFYWTNSNPPSWFRDDLYSWTMWAMEDTASRWQGTTRYLITTTGNDNMTAEEWRNY